MRTALLALLLALVPSLALGQSSADVSQARSLFRTGVERLRANDWEGACEALEQSNALVETAQTHLNLALCSGELGRLLDQSEHLRAFVRLADSTIEPARLEEARATIEQLEPRIPKIVVRVPPGSEQGLQVRVGTQVVPRAAWGAPRPVNPGAVNVEATGGPYIDYRTTLQVGEGETIEVELALVHRPDAVAQNEMDRDGRRMDDHVDDESGTPWWLWAGVGAAVAIGTVVTILLVTQEDEIVRPDFPTDLVFEALSAPPTN